MRPCFCALAAVGIWLFASGPLAHAQQGQVKADTGGVAIGGNVSGSTINIGIPPEQLAALVRQATDLSESQKKLIAKLEGELDLNQRQIHAALDIVGENNVPPERLAAKLVEIAERFKILQETASAQPGDDPKIAALKTDAQKAINAGDLAKADALLLDVETEQTRALDRLVVNAAETSARRGEIALIRLRYGEAAKHFAKAAAVFPPQSTHEDKRIAYLEREAGALYLQGHELGDNGALLSAIERRRRLLELIPREREPLQWAMTQHYLGITLWRLGQRERGTAKLEEAVAAFREALKERTRERAPLPWAVTQTNLGAALRTLGEREGGTERLKAAVTAYREALKVQTRERVPLQWAMTQNNLGVVLATVGKRERGTAKIEAAVAAYREALKERTRERAPLQWARTQDNLGVALVILGKRESGTAKLEEAVAAYREALKERTRERVPLDWAMTLGNEGVALMYLAKRRGDTDMAATALSQINTAFETLRERGHELAAGFFERQLSGARESDIRLRDDPS
jgi:tetratricopeptide (TPR) repeat protein